MPSNDRQIIRQAKFPYSTLGWAFEKQTKKQVGAIKSLDLSNKKDELKQIEGLFPKYLVNDLIRDKLKENINLQDIIKKDDLGYKTTSKKSLIIILNYLIDNFNKYSLSIVFWDIYIYKGHLSL